MADDAGVLAPLSDREAEVLALVCEGLTSREIGAALGLSPKTVENHRARLLVRLGAPNSERACYLLGLAHGRGDTGPGGRFDRLGLRPEYV